MNAWVKYVIWTVGMLLLLDGSFHLEHHADIIAEQTYRLTPEAWIYTLLSFAFGVYISFLLIPYFNFKINKPVLICVFIPCTLIGFYVPVAMVLSIPWPVSAVWLNNVNAHELPTVLSGLSLMVALFSQRKTDK